MKTTWPFAILLLTGLAACDVPPTTGQPGSGYVGTLPESIVALAAPSQDLTRVQLSPEDGCYYYLWDGPVEATLLPLRTREGRPICTQAS